MNSKNNLEMNNKIEICNEGKKAYDIVLRDSFADLLDQMEFLEIEKKKVCIVTESNVAPIYLKEVCELITSKASKTITFSFEAGEKHKQLKTIEALYEELIINHFDRQDLLIALGGGVVGDMTGYAAATYLRGIDFVQVPTTLLSQVDSSIGGKTGVDFLQYKNMVGAFHQPKLVYINTTTLKSLPEREYFSGMGEVIKHGLIKDAAYYEWLKAHKEAILARDTQTVIDMIAVSCHIKKEVVENDPEEAGERALLNFGHTLGHAVEKLMNFTMLHGECVAVGMHAAAWLSMEKGMLTEAAYKDITDTIASFGLPVSVKGLEPEQIVAVSKSDKKMDKGRVKFILLDPEGHAVIDRSIRDEQLLAAASVIVRNGEQS